MLTDAGQLERFFARTFDLDELVTTLSGGNGAGKSTTMAAFITAMIPDLTLLHFRNTTEAGATSGPRDKGLHGKLCAGVCYATLDVVNSRHQRVLVGVRLQQIAGRDKKVDIKPLPFKDCHHVAADAGADPVIWRTLGSGVDVARTERSCGRDGGRTVQTVQLHYRLPCSDV
ncbi:MAG: hypothetical protein ACR5LD_03135 [Symbiopectobacterium sp.]